ncbi:hypothetical protein [Gemmobacter sp. 24YEA27]|uniref:hypothetical protein n=1 Tax=Gemmobacter sp. 24YEA27 TaxID=3040672 RepID=UPI0024B388FE|nr:hypothetical protein [Gemmobacter sp. 24YEA27]
MQRRSFITSLPAVALAAPAYAASSPSLSRDDQISRHCSELARLLAETVPSGTALTGCAIVLGLSPPLGNFIHLTAKAIGQPRSNEQFWNCRHAEEWVFHSP